MVVVVVVEEKKKRRKEVVISKVDLEEAIGGDSERERCWEERERNGVIYGDIFTVKFFKLLKWF